jgi:hypothetical protein
MPHARQPVPAKQPAPLAGPRAKLPNEPILEVQLKENKTTCTPSKPDPWAPQNPAPAHRWPPPWSWLFAGHAALVSPLENHFRPARQARFPPFPFRRFFSYTGVEMGGWW